MVIRRRQFFSRHARRNECGALTTELLVAAALLVFAVIPLAYSFATEQRFLRASYNRAVAMEIVDGEMEILLAGEWRAYKEGTQEYTPRAEAITNLPVRTLQLTITGKQLKLEWQPPDPDKGGKVVREVNVP